MLSIRRAALAATATLAAFGGLALHSQAAGATAARCLRCITTTTCHDTTTTTRRRATTTQAPTTTAAPTTTTTEAPPPTVATPTTLPAPPETIIVVVHDEVPAPAPVVQPVAFAPVAVAATPRFTG